jgi:hypothetical protein
MNAVRVWILHLASIAAIVFGGSLLYDAYQDFAWIHLATAEAGPTLSSRVIAELADEGSNRNRDGRAAEYAGTLLICAGLLMDGLASVLRRLEKKPIASAPQI